MRSAVARAVFATPFVQKAVQRAIGGPRLETVRFSDGHLFDCFTSEKYYWLRDSYEEDEREPLESCLTPDSVLFDVGAHVGFWEVVLAARCRHIYAFEPSPRNVNRLRRNVDQNRITNVTVVPAAVSDVPGTLHIAENGSMSQIAESGGAVQAITLDEYVCANSSPDLVKIDIEGYGATALRGMRGTLAACRPTLFIEIHSSEELTSCRSLLNEFGYTSSPLTNKMTFPYRLKFVP